MEQSVYLWNESKDKDTLSNFISSWNYNYKIISVTPLKYETLEGMDGHSTTKITEALIIYMAGPIIF